MFTGNQIKTAALLGLLSGILVLGGYWAMGNEQGAIIGLIFAAMSSFGSWFYADSSCLGSSIRRNLLLVTMHQNFTISGGRFN